MNFESDKFNGTTDGFLKAFALIANANQRAALGSKNPKFKYHRMADLEHRSPTKADKDRKVHVSHHYAERQDHSRYDANALRKLRANGGGAKERARAALRSRPDLPAILMPIPEAAE